MKNKLLVVLLLVVCGNGFASFAAQNPVRKRSIADTVSAAVPLGGNAWITRKSPDGKELIGKEGLSGWTSPHAVISTWFRVEQAGELLLSLKIRVPDGHSVVRLSVPGKSFNVNVSDKEYKTVSAGKIVVKEAGYIRADLQGISKTDSSFGEVADIVLRGTPASTAVYTKNDEGDFFYWGHRGPSVHLRYAIPPEIKDHVEWFYNEITVRPGDDTEGSYYMANGFAQGYFGMQVNSKTERRVLFSIWSPFTTDDPKNIPDSQKIILLKKGAAVHTGEFGNEGSGGQSYLVYPWKTGKTYAFLTHAKPDAATNSTVFTSWFKEKGADKWMLIASFRRPQTSSSLTNLYSFLENFNPDKGAVARRGFYGNQWVRSGDKWYELTSATFTADATARKNYRKDYAGGAEGRSFFLRNCGFFSDFTPIDTKLKRTSSGENAPGVDVTTLP
ncbi:MAG: DUF3472 domain-containing protein [Mucilaginibacter polytrichastri]|nr:DUF3472 domain-containing protein [Mucilaginibacter polytrichastri]